MPWPALNRTDQSPSQLSRPQSISSPAGTVPVQLARQLAAPHRPAGHREHRAIKQRCSSPTVEQWAARNVEAGSSCFRTPGHTAHVITATRNETERWGTCSRCRCRGIGRERLRIEQQRPRDANVRERGRRGTGEGTGSKDGAGRQWPHESQQKQQRSKGCLGALCSTKSSSAP